jgi:cytochrome c oxidase subunit 2
MEPEFSLHPPAASSLAQEVDALYFYLVGVSGVLTLLVASLVVFFAIRYRRSNTAVNRDKGPTGYLLELSWLLLPLPILLSFFYWGASLYFSMYRPPADCTQIDVVGRQWMWKFQHPRGKREIDELHVPVNQAVRLNMISQDVIHSLYVPAFRVKQDVLPGRYTTLWFRPTQPGRYHLFCAEYCGTNHARMRGSVVVMTPADFQAWLAGSASSEPPAVAGRKLFEQLRCDSCHRGGGERSRGPPLEGIFGRSTRLASGESIAVDEAYLRESILRPQAKVVAGFQPIMPTYEGQISEEGILQIIAYIKSLGAQAGHAETAPGAATPGGTVP